MAVNVEHSGHVDADCLLPADARVGTCLATAWEHTATTIHQTIWGPLQHHCSSNLDKGVRWIIL